MAKYSLKFFPLRPTA